MDPWKMPPREKIYEAFSVLADQRYSLKPDGTATVTSSDGTRQYTLVWTDEASPDTFTISSNDNASRWQGYMGYPIIVILMITGKVKFDRHMPGYFKGIPWNALNQKHKRNYANAVEEILSGIDNESTIHAIQFEVGQIYDQLSKLTLLKPGKK